MGGKRKVVMLTRPPDDLYIVKKIPEDETRNAGPGLPLLQKARLYSGLMLRRQWMTSSGPVSIAMTGTA